MGSIYDPTFCRRERSIQGVSFWLWAQGKGSTHLFIKELQGWRRPRSSSTTMQPLTPRGLQVILSASSPADPEYAKVLAPAGLSIRTPTHTNYKRRSQYLGVCEFTAIALAGALGATQPLLVLWVQPLPSLTV